MSHAILISALQNQLASAIKQHILPELPYNANNAIQRTAFANAYRYPFQAGGKRLRPLLLLLAAGAHGGPQTIEQAMPAALSVEWVHTYSLIHDDLPCMDNDVLRRGLPTSHVAFGQAQALLAGDALLTDAFGFAATAPEPAVAGLNVKILSHAAGSRGMVWGQWQDACGPFGPAKNWDSVVQTHLYKTGCLFAACFTMGALCGAPQWARLPLHTPSAFMPCLPKPLMPLWSMGLDFGLLFQIVDDILDATQSAQVMGKTTAKDAALSKVTAVTWWGVNEAKQQAKSLCAQLQKQLASCQSHAGLGQPQQNAYWQTLAHVMEEQVERVC